MKRTERNNKTTISKLVDTNVTLALIGQDSAGKLWYGAMLEQSRLSPSRSEKWFYFEISKEEAKDLEDLFESGMHALDAPFRRKLFEFEDTVFIREDWKFAGHSQDPSYDTIVIETYEIPRKEMSIYLAEYALRYVEPDRLPGVDTDSNL